jgi:hypothetical protein
MEKNGNTKDTRKLYIPIRWTWNRLQKTCTEKEKKLIQTKLAEQAGIKKHMCWMSEHYAKAEGLGADTSNETEIVVIPKIEMIACAQQTTGRHTFRQEYTKRWSRREVVATHELEFDKWIGDDIYQAEGEDAMQHHSISESQDGSQGEGDIYQAEGEDAMQHHSIEKVHKKRQIRNSRDALHKLQMWGKGAVNGRWFECPHGAVRKDGHQRRPYGFITKDGSPMPRCKRPECVERMRIMSKETVMIPTSEHFHNTSTRGDGLKEINKVQIQRRIIKRRGTEMMKYEQLENSEGGHIIQEAKENNWERIIRFFDSQRAYQDT